MLNPNNIPTAILEALKTAGVPLENCVFYDATDDVRNGMSPEQAAQKGLRLAMEQEALRDIGGGTEAIRERGVAPEMSDSGTIVAPPSFQNFLKHLLNSGMGGQEEVGAENEFELDHARASSLGFVPGDLVVCVDAKNCNGMLNEGQTYTVTFYGEDCGTPTVCLAGFGDAPFWPLRFKRHEEPQSGAQQNASIVDLLRDENEALNLRVNYLLTANNREVERRLELESQMTAANQTIGELLRLVVLAGVTMKAVADALPPRDDANRAAPLAA